MELPSSLSVMTKTKEENDSTSWNRIKNLEDT